MVNLHPSPCPKCAFEVTYIFFYLVAILLTYYFGVKGLDKLISYSERCKALMISPPFKNSIFGYKNLIFNYKNSMFG